jgi:hypothetical protein
MLLLGIVVFSTHRPLHIITVLQMAFLIPEWIWRYCPNDILFNCIRVSNNSQSIHNQFCLLKDWLQIILIDIQTLCFQMRKRTLGIMKKLAKKLDNVLGNS